MAKKNKHEGDKAEVPMSAMIDVVFLLLIFFIATFKENKVEAHLAINMPSPALSRNTEKPPVLFEIYILRNRYLLMGTREVSLDVIEDKLFTVATVDPDQTVMIKVHPDATEGELVSLLDRCGKAGLSQLNVLTLKE